MRKVPRQLSAIISARRMWKPACAIGGCEEPSVRVLSNKANDMMLFRTAVTMARVSSIHSNLAG
jgi:hypothetical protein